MNNFNNNLFNTTILNTLLDSNYIQDGSHIKWLVVFIFEIFCNLIGIILAIIIKVVKNRESLLKALPFLMVLLLIDSFADVFGYYNIKEKYQSTKYILYNYEYLINSKYFDYKWQKNCFQKFDQLKNITEFKIYDTHNKEIIIAEEYFPICFDEPKNYFQFLEKINLTARNSKGVIFTHEIFIEESIKSISIGNVGNMTDFSYAGFSFNIQIKSLIEINKNYDPLFDLEKCSNYSKYENEIKIDFKLNNFYYFLLFANSVIDILVLAFIPIMEIIRQEKSDQKGFEIVMIFFTYFPKVTSCFLMGNSLIEVYNGCVILQNNYYLYQIIFIIYISLSLYYSTIIMLSFIYLIITGYFHKKLCCSYRSFFQFLIFFANIPSLFLNYILIKKYFEKYHDYVNILIFSFFFPFFFIGLLTTIFLWIIWLLGSTANKVTAILQISTFCWTIFSHLCHDGKKKFFRCLTSCLGFKTEDEKNEKNLKFEKREIYTNKNKIENDDIQGNKEEKKSINSNHGNIDAIIQNSIESVKENNTNNLNEEKNKILNFIYEENQNLNVSDLEIKIEQTPIKVVNTECNKSQT